ncbi:MAG: hypothetical protein H6568_14180 [Lewinellaceae bacterium]|nr:hypothetical protein [Saprospiraceae bacterium]MCB9313904.1 hypothetical protein [Lewinellaceae bacterium]
MSKILEMKRIFKLKDSFEYEFTEVKNPKYNALEAALAVAQGRFYPEQETVIVRKLVKRKTSHILYRIRCDYCGGTSTWVGRKDAKFCSAGCRKMAYNERKTMTNHGE